MRFRLIFLLILGLPLCLVGDVIEDFIAAARQIFDTLLDAVR